MKNKVIIILAIVVILVGLFVKFNLSDENVVEGNEVVLYEFWGNGCPYCIRLNVFLEGMEDKYPSLVVKKYEVWDNQGNNNLMLEMAKAYDVNVEGVPAVFINDKFISGFSTARGEEIEAEIQKCLVEECENPGDRIE